MKLNFRRLISPISNLPLVITSLLLMTPTALGEASIGEDALNTNQGMAWAGRGLPFDDIVKIEDSLVKAPLGKVVIDRHGEDPLGVLFKEPFSGPRPGRLAVVSLWGSKVEGCFVQVIVQYAPPNGKATLEGLVPQTLEVGINGQILRLKVRTDAKPKGFQGDYSYTEYENGANRQYSSTWYMTDNLFPVTASAAKLLASAPKEKIKARLTFADDTTKIVEIGAKNVDRWKEAYGFNSACTPPK